MTSYKVLNFALVAPMFGIEHAHCFEVAKSKVALADSLMERSDPFSWLRTTNSASLMVRMRALWACVTRLWYAFKNACVSFASSTTMTESEGNLLPNRGLGYQSVLSVLQSMEDYLQSSCDKDL